MFAFMWWHGDVKCFLNFWMPSGMFAMIKFLTNSITITLDNDRCRELPCEWYCRPLLEPNYPIRCHNQAAIQRFWSVLYPYRTKNYIHLCVPDTNDGMYQWSHGSTNQSCHFVLQQRIQHFWCLFLDLPNLCKIK